MWNRLLFKLTASLLCAAASVGAANKGDPSLAEFFRVTLGLSPPYKKDEHEPIKVIGAGLPRTGTASFVVALNKLGLFTYHMKDGAVETPGHLNLWYNLYVQDTSSFNDILDSMSAYGFNATSDAPACFWYKQQMERYPEAKVVLTVRGGDGSDGEAWAESFSSAIIELMLILKEIPFCWFSMFQKIQGVVQNMLKSLKTDINPQTNYPVVDQLPAAYNHWVETVKATVPDDKLLVHAPRDGWKPLCDFLSPLSPEIASNCDSILASGEPYPHVNDKAKVQGLLVGLTVISTLCKVLPFLLLVAVSVVLLMRLQQRRKQQTVNDKSKSE